MLKRRRTAIKKALEDDDPQVRAAAATALDQLEALDELPQLLAQLTGKNRRNRIAAAHALGKVHSSKVFIPLLEALKSEDPDLRAVVARILGEKRHPKTLAPLVKALDDKEVGVVAEIATALGQFQDPRLPKVLSSLIGREEQVALAAIEALGEIGLPDGEDALLRALNDTRPRLRCKAALALAKLQTAD